MPKSAHLTAALAAAVDAIAQANQVNADDVRNGFAVQPAIAQKMYDEIALNSGLLGKISIVGKPAVSAYECEECGEAIPEARRAAVPGCRCCTACQQEIERYGKTRFAAGRN